MSCYPPVVLTLYYWAASLTMQLWSDRTDTASNRQFPGFEGVCWGGGGGGRGYEWVGVSMWCSVCTLATTNAIHCPSGELCPLSLSRCCLSPRSSLLGSALQTSGAQGVFPVGLCGTAAGDVS